MTSGPDFLIIGAMKCATSTLHDRLAQQPGVFMSEPKEPCFFSDDDVYAKGVDWYADLFVAAEASDLKGESSTHYTKLPTHPRTVERCAELLPPESGLKLIYVMRDPIDRVVSQYIHEWTMRLTDAPIDRAVDELPILVDYSRYAMQLTPWFEAYGKDRVLPVFFERLPQSHSVNSNAWPHFSSCSSRCATRRGVTQSMPRPSGSAPRHGGIVWSKIQRSARSAGRWCPSRGALGCDRDGRCGLGQS